MKTIRFAFLLLLFVNFGCLAQKITRPNVLFIYVDDLRPELGCFGVNQIKTPNIDKLAAEGSIFENSYCNVPNCGPSRASLLTGLRPGGKVRLVEYNCRIDEAAPSYITIPEYLKINGYNTVSNGKVMHVQDDTPQAWTEPTWRASTNRGAGYHYYNIYHDWVNSESEKYIATIKDHDLGPFYENADVSDNEYHDGQLCEKTIEDLKRLSKSDKPFFLACGFWRPHLPFNAPKKYWDLYDRDKIHLASNRFEIENAPIGISSSQELLNQYTRNEGFPDDEEFHKLARHGYYASVSYVDALVGKLMNTLKELALDKNTIVVLLGDHGFHLGEHNLWGKHNMMDRSLRAPLIIKYPGGKSRQRLNQIVEFVDIYPTLCEFVNLPIPEHCEGKSLVPILKTPSSIHKDAIYFNFGYQYSILTDRYLYTALITDKENPKKFMLYDHIEDPEENKNIVLLPEYETVVDRLQNKLFSTFFHKN